MAVTQYIGARYVPMFADPAEWDNSNAYEPLTIVTYQGNSYTSRQAVPVGIDINDESFWVCSGNYNAQVEAYRKEIRNILPYDTTPTQDSTKGITSGGVYSAIEEVSNELDTITPFDTTPTQGSTKGVTSGGVYDALSSISTSIDTSIDTNTKQYESQNPIYYGADPTGTKDSTEAINNCISSNHGGAVIFSDGTYMVSDSIKLPFLNRVSIYGNGAKIVADPNGTTSFDLVQNGYSDNPTSDQIANPPELYTRQTVITGLRLIGNSYTNAIYRQQDHMQETNISFCEFVTFSNSDCLVIGASTSYPGDTWLQNCYVRSFVDNGSTGNGVTLNNSDCSVSTNRIAQFTNEMVCNGNSAFIERNHFLGVGNNSINGTAITISAASAFISKCYFDTKQNAIKTLGSNKKDLIIENSFVYSYTTINNASFANYSEHTNASTENSLIITNVNISNDNLPSYSFITPGNGLAPDMCSFSDITYANNDNINKIHGCRFKGNGLGMVWSSPTGQNSIIGYVHTRPYQCVGIDINGIARLSVMPKPTDPEIIASEITAGASPVTVGITVMEANNQWIILAITVNPTSINNRYTGGSGSGAIGLFDTANAYLADASTIETPDVTVSLG